MNLRDEVGNVITYVGVVTLLVFLFIRALEALQ